MASDHVTFTLGNLTVGSDTTTSRYLLVKVASTAGQVKVSDAVTDKCLGVLYNEPKSGQAAEIAAGGVVKIKAGGSVTFGAYVGPHTNGTIVAKTTDGNKAVGLALQAADSGDIIDVLWQPRTLGTGGA